MLTNLNNINLHGEEIKTLHMNSTISSGFQWNLKETFSCMQIKHGWQEGNQQNHEGYMLLEKGRKNKVQLMTIKDSVK